MTLKGTLWQVKLTRDLMQARRGLPAHLMTPLFQHLTLHGDRQDYDHRTALFERACAGDIKEARKYLAHVARGWYMVQLQCAYKEDVWVTYAVNEQPKRKARVPQFGSGLTKPRAILALTAACLLEDHKRGYVKFLDDDERTRHLVDA